MVKEYEAMDWSKEYTYKDKKIYISHETKKYIICSFNENCLDVLNYFGAARLN